MDLKPLVTIVIPSYNQPDYLAGCLESVGGQTFKDFRVVILDDCSSQDYGWVIQKFSFLNIQYVRNEKNLGAMSNMTNALNYGGDSPYIMVFHEDDRMHPQLLASEVSLLAKDERMRFVATDFISFNDTSHLPEVVLHNDFKCDIYQDTAQFVRALLAGAKVTFGSVLYRRDALNGIKLDLERFLTLGDRPFLCEIARGGLCAFIREPLVYYHEHGVSDSRANLLKERHLFEFLKFYRAQLPAVLDPKDRALFLKFSTNNLIGSFLRLQKTNRGPLLIFFLKCWQAGLFSFWYFRMAGVKDIFSTIRFNRARAFKI